MRKRAAEFMKQLLSMKNVDLRVFFALFAFSLFATMSCDKDEDDPDPMDMPIDTMMVDTMMIDTMMNDTMVVDTMVIDTVVTYHSWNFTPEDYSQDAVQEALILMENRDTINFAAGTYEFVSGLSLLDKDSVVIIGAGMGETVLDFTNQTDGAEGIKITSDYFIVANLTVMNTVGDAIKITDSEHITFWQVETTWPGEASEDNGAYGLYPVQCSHVLIDGCVAYGASDAGIYVGQSEYVIVRNCTAEQNVAGIEIENTKFADVYDNVCTNNTGGLLIFDLPGLPAGQGSDCRVFNNTISENNFKNFASEGNIVASVPPGTGIFAMASERVEIFNNDFINNNIMGLGLVNYEVLSFLNGITYDDPDYISYPRAIYVHDNNFSRTNECPTELNSVGLILQSLFDDCEISDILYDGIVPPGELGPDEKLCVINNANAGLADTQLGEFPGGPPPIINPWDDYDCEGDVLPVVEIDVPML